MAGSMQFWQHHCHGIFATANGRKTCRAVRDSHWQIFWVVRGSRLNPLSPCISTLTEVPAKRGIEEQPGLVLAFLVLPLVHVPNARQLRDWRSQLRLDPVWTNWHKGFFQLLTVLLVKPLSCCLEGLLLEDSHRELGQLSIVAFLTVLVVRQLRHVPLPVLQLEAFSPNLLEQGIRSGRPEGGAPKFTAILPSLRHRAPPWRMDTGFFQVLIFLDALAEHGELRATKRVGLIGFDGKVWGRNSREVPGKPSVFPRFRLLRFGLQKLRVDDFGLFGTFPAGKDANESCRSFNSQHLL
mmetsp:Transcript_49723/g.108337  ORF Transcript_49723/g.108337 Transcript_49723/m.108337 type:complete len:296 (-) Transcript_49723:163-1050(-)